jgi:hypothetical protein
MGVNTPIVVPRIGDLRSHRWFSTHVGGIEKACLALVPLSTMRSWIAGCTSEGQPVHRIMRLYLTLGLSLSVTLPCVAELVNIEYTATDLGRGRWQYRYDVTNNALVCRVEAFVIWFDLGSCAQLSLRTEAPLSTTWRELIAQPDPLLRNDGFYDVLSLTGGIGVGESLGDFSVAFDWAGEGTPGPQVFEIVTPITYEPIFSGTTMPEPAVLGLLGMLLLLRRRR